MQIKRELEYENLEECCIAVRIRRGVHCCHTLLLFSWDSKYKHRNCFSLYYIHKKLRDEWKARRNKKKDDDRRTKRNEKSDVFVWSTQQCT